ncbi:LOW QUALITY PROTEIN: hypothetical protein PHMEG_00015525 [Phytophthora megakarya]|uniref:Uncharacterized protein n=1 Tax=Phytophthora megakarya TaxID=4795 RepID=A0A225W3L5_9STRA|nr:LOW QUALITY PROTEIN: hypothetical protein PHMEG_00015525 [Phytophthora megakarya]
MKVYELLLKLSSSARNWCSQLSPHPHLDFLYRLNVAADRAVIRYKKSERRRIQHVKLFTHRLVDSQLKNILKGPRFKSIDDLEYVLKQQEDDWDDENQDTSSTKHRISGRTTFGRHKTKYPGRAYGAQSGDQFESDERHVMFEDEVVENPTTQEATESREVSIENKVTSMTMEELTQHLLKVMDNSVSKGIWNTTVKVRQNNGHPGSPSPRYGNPDRDMRCDNCNGIGYRADNCWTDLICEN